MPEKKKPTSRWGCWVEMFVFNAVILAIIEALRSWLDLNGQPTLRKVLVPLAIVIVLMVIGLFLANAIMAAVEKDERKNNNK